MPTSLTGSTRAPACRRIECSAPRSVHACSITRAVGSTAAIELEACVAGREDPATTGIVASCTRDSPGRATGEAGTAPAASLREAPVPARFLARQYPDAYRALQRLEGCLDVA